MTKLIALSFIALPIFAQLAVNGPLVCKQSTTCTYTATGGSGGYVYTMVSGSVGSINPSTGVYTAPARIVPKSVINGWQSYPNNHVMNTRIDALPVHSRSAERIDNMLHGPVNLLWGYKSHQTALSTDPPTPMTGYFYGGYIGDMFFPPASKVKSEGGTGSWGNAFLNTASGQVDDHWFSTTRDTGIIQEVYAMATKGYRTGSPNENAEAGTIQSLESFQVSGYGVGLDQIPIEPGVIHMEEIIDAMNGNIDAIQHALRFRHNNSLIAAGLNVWPTIWGGAGHGCVLYSGYAGPYDVCPPVGSRFRIKSSWTKPAFSGSCATTECQNVINALVRAMQRYGMYLGDGTGASDWELEFDGSPYMIRAMYYILYELPNVTFPIADHNTFEIVDESSLETNRTQNYTYTPPEENPTNVWQESKLTNGFVTPSDAAVVKVTDSSSAVAYTSIALQGIAIGVEDIQETFMAGAAPYQFTPWVSGTSNAGLTCTMNPTGGGYGSITSGCLYTPASTGTVGTSRFDSTVTVTSAADSFFTKTFNLTVLPRSTDGKMHMSFGKTAQYYPAAKYTDSANIDWWNDSSNAVPISLTPETAVGAGGSITSAPNFSTAGAIYAAQGAPTPPPNDFHLRIHTPTGSIQTTMYLGMFAFNTPNDHQIGISIDSDGTTVVPQQDINTLVGGNSNAVAVTFTKTISDGILHIAIRTQGVDPFTDSSYTLPRYNLGFGGPLLAGIEIGATPPPIPSNTYRGTWRGTRR